LRTAQSTTRPSSTLLKTELDKSGLGLEETLL